MIIELNDYSIVDALCERFSSDRMNVVVIPTNEKGIFDAGIAKLIRNGMVEVEHMVREAALAYSSRTLRPSHLQTVLTNDPLISLALIPTKREPSDNLSSQTSIVQGLDALFDSVGYDATIIMPRIGTGSGGLMWNGKSGEGVLSLVEKIADRHSIQVIVATKFVYEKDVQRGFGVGREAYDFCVHGWGWGQGDKSQYYAMSYSGMEQMVLSNPHLFPQPDGYRSAWTVLDELDFLHNSYTYRLKESSHLVFNENRNSFASTEYVWRERFTDYVRPPRNSAVDDLFE